MNKERLELMCTMLDEVAAGTWLSVLLPAQLVKHLGYLGYEVASPEEDPTFHLEEWVGLSEEVMSPDHRPACGFTACAVGHAMLDERFNAQGFMCGAGGNPEYIGDGRPRQNWGAVSTFFDIESEDAEHLFMISSYEDWEATKPADVAARIREFIAETEDDDA